MISPVKIWRNQKYVARMIGKRGKIAAWTTIRVPPGAFMDQAPYPVVIVDLESEERITAQLVDFLPEHLAVGQPVIVIVRRIIQPNTDGVIPYGIKVKPL